MIMTTFALLILVTSLLALWISAWVLHRQRRIRRVLALWMAHGNVTGHMRFTLAHGALAGTSAIICSECATRLPL